MKLSARFLFDVAVQAAHPASLIPKFWADFLPAAEGMNSIRGIRIVGFGKAAGSMAEALVSVIRSGTLGRLPVLGQINVPEGIECRLDGIEVAVCRPRGENLSTPETVVATRRMVKLLEQATTEDLIFVLVSGGGSALLCLPRDDITLEDKRQTTMLLASHAANIEQLNVVRQHLSQVKGGGLASRIHAGRVVGLLISDVLGDPWSMIASGPTVATAFQPAAALRIFQTLGVDHAAIPERVRETLANQSAETPRPTIHPLPMCPVENHLLGTLSMAMTSAADTAQRAGYRVLTTLQNDPCETIIQAANRLAQQIIEHRGTADPMAIIDAGEPTVRLCDCPGTGGRNQQLVLQVLENLREAGYVAGEHEADFELLSCGTDGEDGNTTLAGAIATQKFYRKLVSQRIDLHRYLANNDAFTFVAAHELGVDIGFTGTNVGDLRVVLMHPPKMNSAV